ncbi:cytochrome P460 family protein [Pedobacter sp. B4-66]|uniref:heme-binding domain-containing protein n=1 Tax=Pedobacter sp. B4-66 TaxID=2817280 RepID=UPI001BDB4C28|nr:cytochrome P460 family protein [Pedobacter sp. B4-66]
MKKKTIILLILAAIVGLAQFIRPDNIKKYENGVKTEDLAGVPKEVNEILRNSCFNCHSSSSELAWYDKITPVSFLVASHIQEGTEVLNFKDWMSMSIAKQKAVLYYSINKIRSGEMPLSSYILAHPAAKINKNQMQVLEAYLLSISARGKTDSVKLKALERDHKWVKPALNGIAYMPDYRNWKAISTTDRFDNGTMRIIFANEVAVAAIKAKNINPWPDGSVLAKAAWTQEIALDGSVSTGQFVQVEYMIKDSKKYAKTEGWGWARWKGDDLRPYGKTINFTTECISCHRPVRENDNVFTIPLNLK